MQHETIRMRTAENTEKNNLINCNQQNDCTDVGGPSAINVNKDVASTKICWLESSEQKDNQDTVGRLVTTL